VSEPLPPSVVLASLAWALLELVVREKLEVIGSEPLSETGDVEVAATLDVGSPVVAL
jgi:hypothetical protein